MTMREVEHDIRVEAPADEVYRLVAEVVNWPRIFPPTVFVDHVEQGAGTERIRIWATANGEPKNWTSWRELDPAARRIEFRQEVSTPPVAEMSGTWIVEPVSASAAKVRLLHAYRAVDDDPGGLAWIDRAVDRNSRSELAALKHNVELVTNPELTLSFTDTVRSAKPGEPTYHEYDVYVSPYGDLDRNGRSAGRSAGGAWWAPVPRQATWYRFAMAMRRSSTSPGAVV